MHKHANADGLSIYKPKGDGNITVVINGNPDVLRKSKARATTGAASADSATCVQVPVNIFKEAVIEGAAFKGKTPTPSQSPSTPSSSLEDAVHFFSPPLPRCLC